MVPTSRYATYQRLASAYIDSTGEQLDIIPVDDDAIRDEALFEFETQITNAHDAWVLSLDGYHQLQELGAVLDLSNLTETSANAAWSDVPELVQRLSYWFSTNGSSTTRQQVSIPLDGSVPLLYYRTDVLSAANLSVPRTWSEVLHVASRLNGTDLSGNGTRDSSVCFLADPDCRYASVLGMLLSPYLQYGGTAQGAFLQPEDLVPLFGNPGAVAALQVLAALLQYAAPLGLDGAACAPADRLVAFAAGSCAMTFAWGDMFKALEAGVPAGPSPVKGRYGVVPLPGSELVYDRDLRTLMACTAVRCPYGLGGVPEAIERQQDGQSVYVNRASYLPYSGVVGIVSSAVGAERQRRVFEFLAFLSTANAELSLANDSSAAPMRASALSDARLPDFAAAGFDPSTTAAFLGAVRGALAHPNTAPGPIMKRGEALRSLLADAVWNVSRGVGAGEVARQLQAQALDKVVKYEAPWGLLPGLQAQYWAFIGYHPPSQNGSASGRSGGRTAELPAVSLAVPVASAVVVLLLSTLYEFRKHRQHRGLFGKVVAPGPFEDTTLLVTDIQDSTALWETLPSAVMDRAIKEHHACLRKLLLKHNGYESATEGDSFLLAFHCPEDALLFAMEAQVALLECAWPGELLEADICRPAYVVHNDGDRRAGLLAGGRDAGGGLMVLPRAASAMSTKSTSEDTSSVQASHLLTVGGPGPGSESNFLTACQAAWREATAATPNNVLIFRGLRVRMGTHTGVSHEADVAYNKAAARMQYGGEVLQVAKAVSDAAAGGMILLSEATYKRLPMERLWDKAMVMHAGEYRLKDDLPPLPLYQVTGRRLLGRLGLLSGMRFKEQLSKGVFTAPLGAVTLAISAPVGLPALLAWDEALGREAVAIMAAVQQEQAHKWNGYVVECGDSGAQLAFASPLEALLWALASHAALLEAEWPARLLEHEAGEELVVGDLVVFRGLRVRTGLDAGHAVGEVNALSGRVAYRGKVVTRALRVMQTAASNQVLATADAWAAAQAAGSAALSLRGVVGERLGPAKLRGVAGGVELVQVRLARREAEAEAWAEDLHAQGADEGGGGPADASVRAGGAAERPQSGTRGFGFFARFSHVGGGGGGGASGDVLRPGLPRGLGTPPRLHVPPPAAAAEAADAGTVSGAAATPSDAQGSPSTPASPRLLSSLLRSVRTHSFSTAGSLLQRMASGNLRGRRGGGGSAAALVAGSAASATAPPAGAAHAGSSAAMSIPAAGSGGGARGTSPGSVSESELGASPPSGSRGFLRALSRGATGPRVGSPLAAATAPLPIGGARRLLPSWGVGVGSTGGSAQPSSGGGRSPGAGAGPGLQWLALRVATSLPAGRPGTTPPLGALGAAARTAAADCTAGPAAVEGESGAGGAEAGGAGGEEGAAAGGGAGEEPGWYPGEMLGEVLQGVQEEDERGSHRGSAGSKAVSRPLTAAR